jgi:hypothetical protein
MIGGRVKSTRHNHIPWRYFGLDIKLLHQPRTQGMQFQEYAVQSSCILAGDSYPGIAGVVLLLAYPEVFDFKLPPHIHNLIQYSGKHLRIDKMAIHLDISSLSNKPAIKITFYPRYYQN